MLASLKWQLVFAENFAEESDFRDISQEQIFENFAIFTKINFAQKKSKDPSPPRMK